MAFPGPVVADWPILLIQFERTYQTRTSYYRPEEGLRTDETVADAASELVPPQRRKLLLDHALKLPTGPEALEEFSLDHSLHRTVFSPVYGAWVELWHGGATRFLCLDGEREILPIPGLQAGLPGPASRVLVPGPARDRATMPQAPALRAL